MRPAIVIVALACVASAAQARDMRESRYGPRPERLSASSGSAAAYSGPMLAWSGKEQTAAPQPVAPPADAPRPVAAPPQPTAPWRTLGAIPASTAPQLAIAAPLPESLYGTARALTPPTPQPATPPPEPTAPWRKLGALPAQPESPQAPAPAATPPKPAPPTQLAMAPPSSDALGPSLSRTYSVGRQYGLQPDALPPLKPNGMVFIAPSDPQPATKAEPPRHGSAEWLAGGPAGDEADRDAGKDISLR